MPFVKLDCGMLTSTIWDDTDGRILFITALLMAEPMEITEPAEQFEVRTLEKTGWAAPAGWYGYVPAAGIGIVNRAGLERERGLDALERLGVADPQSRSPEHEGRRLIRVNGGFLILNYQKYRDRDYTGAERQRRWRERKQGGAVTVTPLREGETRYETQVEGEDRRRRKKEKQESQKTSPPARRRASQTEPDPLFEGLWSLYPRKLGKARAEKAFRAHVRAAVDVTGIKAALSNFNEALAILGTDEQFIPHGSTWFAGGWRDYAPGVYVPPKPNGSTRLTGQPDMRQRIKTAFPEDSDIGTGF